MVSSRRIDCWGNEIILRENFFPNWEDYQKSLKQHFHKISFAMFNIRRIIVHFNKQQMWKNQFFYEKRKKSFSIFLAKCICILVESGKCLLFRLGFEQNKSSEIKFGFSALLLPQLQSHSKKDEARIAKCVREREIVYVINLDIRIWTPKMFRSQSCKRNLCKKG